MKKMLAFVASLVVGATAAFAEMENAGERSVHALGFDVPVWGQTWYDTENSDDYNVDVYNKFSAVGFNFMYHHLNVSENRFSSFVNVEFGYSSWSYDEIEIDGHTVSVASVNKNTAKIYDGMSGFNTRFSFGLGGAPINIDRVILAVHGTFGVNLSYGGNSTSAVLTEDNDDYNATFDTWIFNWWTTMGVNVESAFKLTDHFGLFAGMNMYINLIGFGAYGYEATHNRAGVAYTPVGTPHSG